MSNQTTIDAYDTFAQAYDQGVVDFWTEFPQDFLHKFVGGLQGKRVLNLGSGSGRDAVLLRQLGVEVVCVDASKSMIDITAKLDFESYHTDFENMTFDLGSFDGVWAYCLLLHINRRQAAEVFRKLHTYLKPSSLCVVGVIEGDSEAMVEHEIMPGTSRYFQFYTNNELKRLVHAADFTIVHEQEYVADGGTFLSHIYEINK
ncbi:MAG: class I SAM-dependent methyltransferase [Candidatus Saccharibacteria bacterium]